MSSCQILVSVLPFETLHAEIHNAVVEDLATRVGDTRQSSRWTLCPWLPGAASRCKT